MTLPPPSVCRRIRKLHALMGSPNEGEASAARKKLNELLAEYQLTWNDIPELLAASDSSSSQQAASSQQAPPDDGQPKVNVYDLVFYFVEKYVAITPAERVGITLWILHTWIFDRFTITPRLALLSPVRGCGKTTLLALIEYLTAQPLRTDDISPASVYHHITGNSRACLLVDEADNADLIRNRTLRAVFNSGHRKGGGVTRFVSGRTRRFLTFAPLAVAAIGVLPLPLLHRSVLIRMQRQAQAENLAGDSLEFSAGRDQIRR
jgi:Protein of unknown function (DUF2786)